jgi:pyruvate dehydrogenase E1 component alpha subunit
MLAEIYERRSGLCGGFGGHMHLFDLDRRFSTTGIVGSTLPVALGHAHAAVIEGRDSVAVGITGDGGANTGAFHESLNLAAVWKLPLVVLIENNEWAISVPFSASTATETLAERAAAYGAWGKAGRRARRRAGVGSLRRSRRARSFRCRSRGPGGHLLPLPRPLRG